MFKDKKIFYEMIPLKKRWKQKKPVFSLAVVIWMG